jgi:hypothetical protein
MEHEFTALLPHFERAVAADLQDRTIDGHPRTSRRFSAYGNGPLPTLADKRLFILTYLKQNPMLHPVLNQALAAQALLPARTAAELAAIVKTPATGGRVTTPLFGMMALNGRSTARPIPTRNQKITAARRSVTRSKTSSCSTRPGTWASCATPLQAKPRLSAWQSWLAIPCHLAAAWIKLGASRGSACRT